jgi:hypothetical protein
MEAVYSSEMSVIQMITQKATAWIFTAVKFLNLRIILYYTLKPHQAVEAHGVVRRRGSHIF